MRMLVSLFLLKSPQVRNLINRISRLIFHQKHRISKIEVTQGRHVKKTKNKS